MKWIRHTIITVLAFCIVGVLALTALNISFLEPMARVIADFSMTDAYYQILQETDEPEENDQITIVDMSELYSRRDLAKTLREIEALQPRVIGVDVVFEGLKEDSIGDEMIWDVAEEFDNMVFAYRLLDYENDSTGFTDAVHSFFAEDLEVNEGYVNMQRNLYGGIKRTLSLSRRYQGKEVPSLVAQLVNTNDSEDLNINFTPTRFAIVQPDSMKTHIELIQNRIVLFGAMTDESDMHYTPLGKMAGAELIAYAVQTITDQSEVWEMPHWLLAIVSFLLVLLTEVGYTIYATFADGRRNRILRFLLSSSFTKSILVVLWLIFLGWIAYIAHFRFHVSVNLGWALSVIAILELARNFYNECVTLIKDKNI